jgi:hypothetical protein
MTAVLAACSNTPCGAKGRQHVSKPACCSAHAYAARTFHSAAQFRPYDTPHERANDCCACCATSETRQQSFGLLIWAVNHLGCAARRCTHPVAQQAVDEHSVDENEPARSTLRETRAARPHR